jgi:hypothetical protein
MINCYRAEDVSARTLLGLLIRGPPTGSALPKQSFFEKLSTRNLATANFSDEANLNISRDETEVNQWFGPPATAARWRTIAFRFAMR